MSALQAVAPSFGVAMHWTMQPQPVYCTALSIQGPLRQGARMSQKAIVRIARAALTPILASAIIFGGLILLVSQKIEIPFLYRNVQASDR